MDLFGFFDPLQSASVKYIFLNESRADYLARHLGQLLIPCHTFGGGGRGEEGILPA